MTFDERAHPRATTGRFQTKPDHDPELTLPPAEDEETVKEWGWCISELPEPTTRPAVDWNVDREEVAPNLAAFDEYVDMFVGSIDEGHLSRGVAGTSRAHAARAWMYDASDAADLHGGEAEDFHDGFRQGLVALYGGKLGFQSEHTIARLAGEQLDVAAEDALLFAVTKRASRSEREMWRRNLKHATPGEHRGMLVAAAALSGTDHWWGFRDRPRAVMSGEL